jgi:hypothetical protein
MPDCVAERGGFEPPVPRGLYGREFGPGWRTIRPDKKHQCWREFVRLRFTLPRLSPVRFVRQVEGRCCSRSSTVPSRCRNSNGEFRRWSECAPSTAGCRTVDVDAQAKALRLRMYVLCSECARLIDIAEGNRPQREVEGVDFIRHAAEERKCSASTTTRDSERS